MRAHIQLPETDPRIVCRLLHCYYKKEDVQNKDQDKQEVGTESENLFHDSGWWVLCGLHNKGANTGNKKFMIWPCVLGYQQHS